MLNIITLPVGMAQANCYIIHKNGEALIVDPGADGNKIQEKIKEADVKPFAILLTHTHLDHIGAVDEIRDAYDIPVYVSKEEKDWLTDPAKNLSGRNNLDITAREAEHLFYPEEDVKISDFSFKVVSTPGHSPGSVSLIFADDEFVISGDALFAGSIGRTDLPGSEPEKLIPGIREQLFSLPENYRVFSGHGGDTTIGKEMQTNPFFV
jgi:glyoxylase-like metal-dependent hydrolase (beta-lactamase superfamily II)